MCGKYSKNSAALWMHANVVHKGLECTTSDVLCEVCGETFKNSDTLKFHKSNAHKVTVVHGSNSEPMSAAVSDPKSAAVTTSDGFATPSDASATHGSTVERPSKQAVTE